MHEEMSHDYTPDRENVGTGERIASVLAGAALVAAGARRLRSGTGMLGVAAGAVLVYRGATGHCPLFAAIGVSTAEVQGGESTSVPYGRGIRVEQSITIQKPVDELYRFWRKLDNLPLFMEHLESVTLDGDRSHWVAHGPAGRSVEWDAEIVNEIENELIGWRSLEGADVDHAGSVHFNPLPQDRGTEIRVLLQYAPPAGKLGAAVAKLFGEEPNQQLASDLRRLRGILEAGEEPSTEGQPRGQRR